jgi:glycyl-tRNA synthetase beta chain
LRRQTLGIIHIILDKGYSLSLGEVVDKSLSLLTGTAERPRQEIKADVLEFFRGRMQNLFAARGISSDVVEAASAVGFDDPVDLERRAQALQDLKKDPDFEPLAVAFKRVVNISKSHPPGRISMKRFEKPVEKNLFVACQEIGRRAEEQIMRKDFPAALKELSLLRKPVDEFFEGVMVMAEDEKVKKNRLSLLAHIARLFFKIGDFSKITTV